MKINKKSLNEDSTLEQAIEDGLGADIDGIYSASQMPKILNRYLKVTEKRIARAEDPRSLSYPGVMFISDPGAGKTSIIEQWAKENDINLVLVSMGAVDAGDFGGAGTVDEIDNPFQPGTKEPTFHKVRSSQLDNLQEPRSVLWLDEFNRGNPNVRQQVLQLVASHRIVNPGGRGKGASVTFFPNFLFTIAAINPGDSDDQVTPITPAESNRFDIYYIKSDVIEYKNYQLDRYRKEIEREKDPEEKERLQKVLNIADYLLSSPDFEFEGDAEAQLNPNAQSLSARSLERALDYSDGTTKDFLNILRGSSGPTAYQKAKEILANYKEVDDKANQALDKYQDGEEVEVKGLQQKASASSRLADFASKHKLTK